MLQWLMLCIKCVLLIPKNDQKQTRRGYAEDIKAKLNSQFCDVKFVLAYAESIARSLLGMLDDEDIEHTRHANLRFGIEFNVVDCHRC